MLEVEEVVPIEDRGGVPTFEERAIDRVAIGAYGKRPRLLTFQEDLGRCRTQVRRIEHQDALAFRATHIGLLWGSREDQVGGLVLGCLLYTSPSPRDRTRSRMPSSA